jgi:hypothetical protein
MRTTLNIDEDVLAAAREIAKQQRKSLGTVISSLVRQALESDRQAEVFRSRDPDA